MEAFVKSLTSPRLQGLWLLVAFLSTTGHGEEPTLREVRRIGRVDAYFLQMPSLEPPCGQVGVFDAPGLVEAVDEGDRKAFQQLRAEGGRFDEKVVEVRRGMEALGEVYEELLLSGAAMFRAEKHARTATALSSNDGIPKHWQNVARYFLALDEQLRLQAQLHEIADEYYSTFASVARVLTPEEQGRILEAFLDRLECLRRERNRVFQQLYAQRVEVAGELAGVIAEDNGQAAVPTQDEETSRKGVQRFIRMQRQYWLQAWLLQEFGHQLEHCSKLIRAVERSLTHLRLQPALEAVAATRPSESLPLDAVGRDLLEELARLRATQGLLALYRKEAKLELVHTQRVAEATFGWGPFKELFLAASGTVQRASDPWRAARQSLSSLLETGRSSGAVPLRQFISATTAVAFGFSGATVDLFVGSHGREILQQMTRNATGVEIWRSALEESHRAYADHAARYAKQITLLERLAEGLSFSVGSEALAFLRGEARGNPPRLEGVRVASWEELLKDHEFLEQTGGGLAHILAPFAEDPGQLRAVTLLSARDALDGAIRAARARRAASRGKPLQDPDRGVEAADVDLRIVKHSPESLLQPPPSLAALAESYFGEGRTAYDSPKDFLSLLERQREDLGALLEALAKPTVDFDLDRLARRDRRHYQIHLALQEHCFVYADALRRLHAARWTRIAAYNQARPIPSETGKVRVLDQARVGGGHAAASMDILERERKLAFLKFFQLALTGRYAAAAQQLRVCEQAHREHQAVWEESEPLDLSPIRAELIVRATQTKTLRAWEPLFTRARRETVSDAIERLSDHPLVRMDPQWMTRFAAGDTDQRLELRLGLANRWWSGMVRSGSWEVLSGPASQIVRRGIEETIALRSEQVFSPQAWAGREVDAVVATVWAMAAGVAPELAARVTAPESEVCASWAALAGPYDAALHVAHAARETLDSAYERLSRTALLELAEFRGWAQLDTRKRQRRFETIGNALGRESGDSEGHHAFQRYESSWRELDAVYAQRRHLENSLREVLVLAPFCVAVEREALARMRTRPYIDAAASPELGKAAAIVASAGLRCRLVLGAHSLEDVASLSERDLDGTRGQILRPGLPIGVLRRALIDLFGAAGSAAGRREVTDAARKIDSIRTQVIGDLLAGFLEQSPLAKQVATVVRNGAGEENPEYRGIFSPLAFTILTHEKADTAGLYSAVRDFFSNRGYPLSESAVEPGSLDCAAFVHARRSRDSVEWPRPSVATYLGERHFEPTRFFTPGGRAWRAHRTAFNGKTLWQSPDDSPEPPGRVRRAMGYGMALEQTRFLGFLFYPEYSKGSLQASLEQDPGRARVVLGKALTHARSFLRLLDAYQVAHPVGNEEFNGRLARRRADDKGFALSYHYQIFQDAKTMVARESQGAAKTLYGVGDSQENLRMVRWLAELALEREHDSPWQVLERDGVTESTAQLRAAVSLVYWMQDMAPRIVAHNATVWHDEQVRLTQSDEASDQEEGFANLRRMITLARSSGGLCGAATASFLVPKVSFRSGNATVMREKAHVDTIWEGLTRALRRPKGTVELLLEIAESQKGRDVDGSATRTLVRRQLAEYSEQLEQPGPTADVFYDEIFQPWVRYAAWVGGGARRS